MNKVLKAYGFGKNLCRWIVSFYKNIKSYVTANGKISTSFLVNRGNRQGDPISPYLFILCAEILACKVRQNGNIKGIKIANNEHKINQFADDTTFTLQGDQISYEVLFETLDGFENISGLKLNTDKTKNKWLGKMKNSNKMFLPHIQMDWNPEKLKILGLWFTTDINEMTEINTADKLIEIRFLFKVWLKRTSTPLGRVAILKSIILSKLIYLWILLPRPPEKLIKQLQDMCFNFVWDGKRDKIKRKYAIHTIQNGGIDIPDISTFIKSLKLSWVRKININDSKWKALLKEICPEIENMNEHGPNKFLKITGNAFWKEVFMVYSELCNKTEVKTGAELAAEPLFDNDKFKIDNKTFYFRNWFNNRVKLVQDLTDKDGNFLSYNMFIDKYKIRVNPLHFLSCIKSIETYKKRMNIKSSSSEICNKTKAYRILMSITRGSRIYYNILLDKLEIYDIAAFIK